MLIGHIIGTVTTTNFSFSVEDSVNATKFSFIQVKHEVYGSVLCQILEIEKTAKATSASCIVIGYKDKEGILRQPRTPFNVSAEVYTADDSFIQEVIKIDAADTAFIGTLEGKDNIRVYTELNKLLTKHIAILAKTGAGKSYVGGVIVEEILEKKIPLLIIDPHGEYGQMRYENDEKRDIIRCEQLAIKPKGYKRHIQEYGDIDISGDCKPLLLNEEMTPRELLSVLPAKLTSNQQAALYTVIRDSKTVTLSRVMEELSSMDPAKNINVVSMIDHLKSLNIFSSNYTPYTELIKSGTCSIINLKGIEPEVQDVIVYRLLKDLFEMRKAGKISPFFCVIEEAHNFVPEKGTGEKKSSSIIRTIASEGRKFGLGLCVITQRPARIEKNVLSQCTTHVILKVTNVHDLKAISSSVEGITKETEDEIQNLPIGTALITGISDMPFFVKIRPRRSKHGGNTQNLLQQEPHGIIEHAEKFQKTEILPVIDSKTSVKDIKLMQESEKKVETYLIPAVMVTIKAEPYYRVLIDLVKGHVISDIAKKELVPLKEITRLDSYQTYENIEFKRIVHDKKLVAKMTVKDVLKKLKILADVLEHQECYVVYHYAS